MFIQKFAIALSVYHSVTGFTVGLVVVKNQLPIVSSKIVMGNYWLIVSVTYRVSSLTSKE
jgi:hypothetical protein